MKQIIKDKITELFNSTPKEVGVGWGKKKKNGKFTDEIGIIFTVEKKKPIGELSKDELLPSSIEIDGKTYHTDVIEVGAVRLLACNPATQADCYDWYDGVDPIYIPNWDKMRPIMGGIQMSSDNQVGYVGTLGAVVVDNETDSLVGLTNNHVVVGNPFYTSERSYNIIENEEDDTAYQDYIGVGNDIGKVIRYVPVLKVPDYNYVDGAIVSLNESVVDLNESFKQFGLSYNLPMEFATTEEIDDLFMDSPSLYNSGRSTGPKEGSPCGLIVTATNQILSIVGYTDGGVELVITFAGCIVFSRIDDTCAWPIYSGDSGSVLIADYGGTWKIVGLCFAGGTNYGFACRIDKVAEELNISAWDGSAKNFIDLSSQEIITVNGVSADKTITCNGKTYWQIGSGLTNNPCVE